MKRKSKARASASASSATKNTRTEYVTPPQGSVKNKEAVNTRTLRGFGAIGAAPIKSLNR